MIKELFPYKTTLPRNSRPHVYNNPTLYNKITILIQYQPHK